MFVNNNGFVLNLDRIKAFYMEGCRILFLSNDRVTAIEFPYYNKEDAEKRFDEILKGLNNGSRYIDISNERR